MTEHPFIREHFLPSSVMAYVDDARQSFDAAAFATTLTAAVGTGRTTAPLALRDEGAVSLATTTLLTFVRDSQSPPPTPDVISAYVTLFPTAPHLFTCLRALKINPPIVDASLSALIAIVRYSLDESKPLESLHAARSVVKEVVKGRVTLLVEILREEKLALAKKTLELLRLVAICSPVLAKELVTRVDLGEIARTLCTESNSYCRVPYLDLLFSLLTCGDYDLLGLLATRESGLWMQALRVVTARAIQEAKITDSEKPWKVYLGYIQKRELIAAINLLMAIERHIWELRVPTVRRYAWREPAMDVLSNLATLDMPHTDRVPRDLQQDHQMLRNIAKRLFVTALTTGSTEVSAARYLGNINVSSGERALMFVLSMIEAMPRIAPTMLDKGKYLKRRPELNSAWFANAAVIGKCVMRLKGEVKRFKQSKFFEACLEHEDALVRGVGIGILKMYCRVVERAGEGWLPNRLLIESLVKKGEDDDLLSIYERITGEHMGNKADPVKLSLEMVDENTDKAASLLHTLIQGRPGQVRRNLETMMKQGVLRKVIEVGRTKGIKLAWNLSQEIMRKTELFLPGSEGEIDIFLTFLWDQTVPEDCLKDFEKMMFRAWQMPFGLYDQVVGENHDSDEKDRVSLLASAAVFKLKKLTTKSRVEWTPTDAGMYALLSGALRMILSCQRLIGSGFDGSFLQKQLPSLLSNNEIWWDDTTKNLGTQRRRMDNDCEYIINFFADNSYISLTPYLAFVREAALARLHDFEQDGIGKKVSSVLNSGAIWSAWTTFQKRDGWGKAFDLLEINTRYESTKTASPALVLGYFVEKIHQMKSEEGMHRCINILKEGCPSDEDFCASVSKVLLITRKHSVRAFLTCIALDILFPCGTRKRKTSTSSRHLKEAVLHAVRCSEAWHERHISAIVRFVYKVLSEERVTLRIKRLAPFCFSVLASLLNHEDAGTRILVQRSLRNDVCVWISFPAQPTFYTGDMSFILKDFPSLQHFSVTQLAAWNKPEEARELSHLPNFIPLLSATLNLDMTTDMKRKYGYDSDLVIQSLLKTILLYKKPIQTRHKDFPKSLRDLGKAILRSKEGRLSCFTYLRSSLKSSETVSADNLIFLLSGGLSSAHDANTADISDSIIVEILCLILDRLGRIEMNLDCPLDGNVTNTIQLFNTLLRIISGRKIALYGSKETNTLERQLTFYCSSALRSTHAIMQGDTTGKKAMRIMRPENQIHLERTRLVFESIYQILQLDLLLDKAAKRSLFSMCRNDGSLMRSFITGLQSTNQELDEEALGRSALIAKIVMAALQMLPRFGIEEDVARNLSIVEGVLSSPFAGYSAGADANNVSIRNCMEKVSTYLRVNQARMKFQMLERRMGYFAAAKSQVMPMFNIQRLERTCTDMLEGNRTVLEPMNRPSQLKNKNCTEAYDVLFFLRTFLVACAEALKTPTAAVLDFGRIIKQKLLVTVIIGTACEDEGIRGLSYACLNSFAEAVGPISGLPMGSAASLYKHRSQLAFVLKLLRDSVPEPMMKIAPIFALWFTNCLTIALSPSHPANKVVTYFFLRAPTMDILDCAGIVHLLKYKDFQISSERRASRLLGVSILRQGIVTLQDFSIFNRRKLMDALFLYGGTSLGDDPRVREEAYKALISIVAHDDGSLTEELINVHGILTWLLPLSIELEEPISMLTYRIELLKHVAMKVPKLSISADICMQFSASLNCLLRRFKSQNGEHNHGIGESLFKRVISCCTVLSSLAPGMRRLFDTNISSLRADDGFLTQPFRNRHLAEVIARQEQVVMTSKVYVFLLESTLPTREDKSSFSALEALQRPESLDINMIHAYVADGITFCHTWQVEDAENARMYEVLAQAMFACPTIWLVVACFSTLHRNGHLSEEIAAYAHRIPGLVPDEIVLGQAYKFCNVVDELRPVLVDRLMSCAMSMQGYDVASQKEIGLPFDQEQSKRADAFDAFKKVETEEMGEVEDGPGPNKDLNGEQDGAASKTVDAMDVDRSAITEEIVNGAKPLNANKEIDYTANWLEEWGRVEDRRRRI